MTMLLDNDIALKACRYTSVADMLALLSDQKRPGVLGSARYVLTARLRRRGGAANEAGALACLRELLDTVDTLEPDEGELFLAADMQEEAQRTGLPLDGGESQLLAMMLCRSGTALLTGDKRAVAAAEVILGTLGHLPGCAGRLACLEQLAASLEARLGTDTLRTRICADQGADRAMTNCFACHSPDCRSNDVAEGLASYLADLRSKAPLLLAPGSDLSVLVT